MTEKDQADVVLSRKAVFVRCCLNSNVFGVGCNIAKALTTLGDDVELISFLGRDDESERVINDLKSI